MNWIRTSERKPPEGVLVHTKIHDHQGLRNEQKLVYHRGMWFDKDMVMYVYYVPTHWASIEPSGVADSAISNMRKLFGIS